jgi:PAS domain S-box-containing protein
MFSQMFTSLRSRLFLLIALVSIPIFWLVLYGNIQQRRMGEALAENRTLALAQQISLDQEHIIEGARQLLLTLLDLHKMRKEDYQELSHYFSSLVKRFPVYSNIGMTLPDGTVVSSGVPMPGPTNFSDREWYPRVMETKQFTVSRYLVGRITGVPSIVCLQPLLDETNNIEALVFASIDLTWVSDKIAQSGFPAGSAVHIADDSGRMLVSVAETGEGAGKGPCDEPQLEEMVKHRAMAFSEHTCMDGVKRLHVSVPLSDRFDMGFYVITAIPSKVVYAEANRLLRWNLLFLGVAILLACLVAWRGGDKMIFRPAERLLYATQRIQEGDLSLRSGPPYPGGTFGVLTKAFDDMTASLMQMDLQRREAREDLVQKEAFFRSLIENSSDIMAVLKQDGAIFYQSPSGQRILGWEPDELVGENIAEFIHPDDLSSVMKQFVEAFQSPGALRKVEYRFRHKGGSWHYLASIGKAQTDPSGEIVGFVNSRDITERREAEDTLRRVSDMLLITNRIARIGGWEMNVPTGELEWSEVTRDLHEVGPDFVPDLQNAVTFYKEGESRDKIVEAVTRCMETGEPFDVEVQFISARGTELWVRSMGDAEFHDGKCTRLRGAFQDITQGKQGERDRTARQAAEEASRAKSAFVSNMSHEIRTPLNAIIGFSQILERDASLTARQAEQVRTIGRGGRHLLNLINDILDMSKIEAGRLTVKAAPFCLHELLDDLETMFRSRAEAKGLQLLVERQDSVPRHVTGDEGKLRQVLFNLMGNAVKFTQTGGVAVRVRADAAPGDAPQDKGALRLLVEVEDTGPGIAKGEIGRLFDAFWQSEAGREIGGTGLGLPISRRLVELMGGAITVESQEGKGSCFRFHVTVKRAEGVPEKEESESRRVIGLEAGTGPFRILVVDDQKDNRDLLIAMLAPVGFEVKEAANGQEALEAFEQWSPHAVLMDMRMPVMDGYEAARRIKGSETGRSVPVIAVTAIAFEDDEEEVRATGVDGYARKPFRPEELFGVLGKCLGLRYVYAEEADKTRDKTSAGSLTREDLTLLPKELVRAMRQAVEQGDMMRLKELIAQVEKVNADAASGLLILARNYDYERLNRVLEP